MKIILNPCFLLAKEKQKEFSWCAISAKKAGLNQSIEKI